jgi:hypothetical protein
MRNFKAACEYTNLNFNLSATGEPFGLLNIMIDPGMIFRQIGFSS